MLHQKWCRFPYNYRTKPPQNGVDFSFGEMENPMGSTGYACTGDFQILSPRPIFLKPIIGISELPVFQFLSTWVNFGWIRKSSPFAARNATISPIHSPVQTRSRANEREG